jgi:hypothetical protein
LYIFQFPAMTGRRIVPRLSVCLLCVLCAL